jgi:hypothetical protein
VGFREGTLPILMYWTNSGLRDPDAGDPSPGGCPLDAGSEDLGAAITDLGGVVIGTELSHSIYADDMTDVAERTGSLADTDGDGDADDPLVFTWAGSATTFVEMVVTAVEQAVDARTFARAAIEVAGDEHGFVVGVDPGAWKDVHPGLAGTTASFTLTFHGTVPATTEPQVFPLTLTVMGDDRVLLATETLSVVVPAASP